MLLFQFCFSVSNSLHIIQFLRFLHQQTKFPWRFKNGAPQFIKFVFSLTRRFYVISYHFHKVPETIFIILTDLSSMAFKGMIVLIQTVNGHRKQLRVTEYQQNCFLCLAFIDAR